MFGLQLLKNPVPLDYPFSCTAGWAHTILVYTGLHTLPLILLAESRDAVWPGSSVGPFPNLYYCQPVPGNTVTFYLPVTGEGQRGPIAEEMKHVYLPRCYTQMNKAKQIRPSMVNTAETWHSFCLGLLPCGPKSTRTVLFPFSSISLPLLNIAVIQALFWGAPHLWSYFPWPVMEPILPAVKTLSL